MSKRKDYYDALDDLLDRPIAFNPAFKKITGRTSAAVWLSQVYYWSKRTSDPDGWFWKTAKECEEETGLTDNEQKTAREICVKLGVVEEKLKGVPATLYYRLIKSKMYELLGVQFPTEQETEIPTEQETSSPSSSKQVSRRVGNINKNTEITSKITTTTTKFGNLFSEVNTLPYCDYPDDIRELCFEFCKLYHFTAPDKPKKTAKSQYSFWILSLTDLKTAGGEFGISALREQRKDFEEYMKEHNGVAPFTVSSPQSLVNAVRGKAALMRDPKYKHAHAPQQEIDPYASLRMSLERQGQL